MSRIHLDSPSSTKPHIVCIHELRGQKSWLTVCMLMHVISIWIRRSEPEILLKITITPIRFTFPLLYLLSSLIASADFIHLNGDFSFICSNIWSVISKHSWAAYFKSYRCTYGMYTQSIYVYRSYPYCQYLIIYVHLRKETPPRAQTHAKIVDEDTFLRSRT